MYCVWLLFKVLISGTSSGVSIDELRANCSYAAGYHALDRNIARFWAVIQEFEEPDKALLLKFVTACERPPSLGFSALNPLFTIQVCDILNYAILYFLFTI